MRPRERLAVSFSRHCDAHLWPAAHRSANCPACCGNLAYSHFSAKSHIGIRGRNGRAAVSLLGRILSAAQILLRTRIFLDHTGGLGCGSMDDSLSAFLEAWRCNPIVGCPVLLCVITLYSYFFQSRYLSINPISPPPTPSRHNTLCRDRGASRPCGFFAPFARLEAA